MKRVEKINDYFPGVKQVLDQTSEEWVKLRHRDLVHELANSIRRAPGRVQTIELSRKLFELVYDRFGDDKKSSSTYLNGGATLYGSTLWIHPNLTDYKYHLVLDTNQIIYYH